MAAASIFTSGLYRHPFINRLTLHRLATLGVEVSQEGEDPLRLTARYPLQTLVDGVIKIFHELERLGLFGYEKPSLFIRTDGTSMIVSFTLRTEGDAPPATVPHKIVVYAADAHGIKVEAMYGAVCIDALDLGNDPGTNYGSAVLPSDPRAPSVDELRDAARVFAVEMAELHHIPLEHVSEEPLLMTLGLAA